MTRPKGLARKKSYENLLTQEQIDKALDIFSKVGDVESIYALADALEIDPKFHGALSGLYRSKEGKEARLKATLQSRQEFYAQCNADDGTSEHPSVIDENEILELMEHEVGGFSIRNRPDTRLDVTRASFLREKPLTETQQETILAALGLIGMKSAEAYAKYVDADPELVRIFLKTNPAIEAASKATDQSKQMFRGLVAESHTMTKRLYSQDRQ